MKKQTLTFIILLSTVISYSQNPHPVTAAIGPNEKSKNAIVSDLKNIYSFRSRNQTNLDFLKITYNDYVIERDRYKADPKASEPTLSYIPGCDSFFKYDAPKLVAKQIDGLKAKLADDERTKTSNPTFLADRVEQQVKMVDYYSDFLMPDDPLKKQLADIKAKMQKTSGASVENIQKAKENALNNKEFPKAASSNPTWEAAASSAVVNLGKSQGEVKVLKAVTTTSTWAIKKNALDVPLYRYQWVAVGYSQGGKCYIRPVDVQQTYSGGGTWNAGYTYSPSGLTEEIPCTKIH